MATPAAGSVGALTTKGDILATNAAGEVDRLPVGADGSILVADSTQPLGLKYAGGAGGGPGRQTLTYGGNMGSGDVGKCFEAHGISNGGKFTYVGNEYRVEIVAMSAGKLFLAWRFQNVITSITLQFMKNGLLVGVPIGLTTQSGTMLTAESVVQGDRIAVEYHQIVAGSTIGQSIVELALV
jgi:hypothetical protein